MNPQRNTPAILAATLLAVVAATAQNTSAQVDALPPAGLFTEVRSQIQELDGTNTFTAETDEFFATESKRIPFGLEQTSEIINTRDGIFLNSGNARSSITTGLGVNGQTELSIGLIDFNDRPRRTRIDATASHIRHFMLTSDDLSVDLDTLEVLVAAEGTLQLERLVQEALTNPSNNTMFAVVSLEVSIMQEAPGVPGILTNRGSLFESATLTANDFFSTNGWFTAFDVERTQDLHTADLGFFANVSRPQNDEGPLVFIDIPFSIEYSLGITVFTDFANEVDNAAGWGTLADFGNTATMTIAPTTPGVTLIELTPQVALTTVPEPTSVALITLASASLLRRRR